MANYLSDLKSRLTPEQYQALTKPLMYTANEKYGGNVQDYQAQLLMPLDVKSLKIKKKLDVTPATTGLSEGAGDGYVVYQIPAQLNEAGYHPIYSRVGESAADVVDGYTSDTPEIVNGVPVYGNYNLDGELMYYTGAKDANTWVDGNNFLTGYWDPSGKPAPSAASSGGGGFFGQLVDNVMSNPLLATAANVAAAYYGGPLGSAVLQLAQGHDLESAAKAAALTYGAQQAFGAGGSDPNAVGGVYGPDNIDVGGGWSPAAGAASAAGAAGTALSDVGAGNADKAALYGDAGYGAGMTGAETSAFDTGLAAGGAGLAAGATGGAAGAAGAAGGAAAGTALADILPYTAAAGVVGSVLQADAAKTAADQQTAAANAAIAQQQKNFDTINAQQAPYRAAGYNSLNNIASLTTGQTPQYDASGNIVKDANGNPVMTTGSGYFQHQFDKNDLTNGLAPNYDFMLGQGQMANQRAANMGGGAIGGNALQGLNKYTQDYAGNAYQNAFNNYQSQRTGIYNTLAGIAGIGQTGQTATNTAATNATNAASQLGIGSAAAQAAGTTGAANAYGNALNNVTNQYTLAALLNQGGRVGG